MSCNPYEPPPAHLWNKFSSKWRLARIAVALCCMACVFGLCVLLIVYCNPAGAFTDVRFPRNKAELLLQIAIGGLILSAELCAVFGIAGLAVHLSISLFRRCRKWSAHRWHT